MASEIDTVWTREEAQPPVPQLSREAIVAAAVEIADAEGLAAVSIRRLATKLNARPMSLYSHIERKGDLIDLMVDAALAGAVLPDGPPPDDWREGLRQIAQRTRATIRAHPWAIAAAFGRPMLGPNSLRHVDQSLAAVASLPLSPERKRAVLLAVDTYTLGFVRWEAISYSRASAGPCAALADTRSSAEEIDAYIASQAASGNYPHLSEFARQGVSISVTEERFEVGLEWLLAGIEAEVREATARSQRQPEAP
jgi:AcrR family transcriptional regulator